jgi:hypothetical protein
MAKKAMLLALVLLAAGLIAGCSGGEDESVQETQAVEPADTDNVEEQAAPPAEEAPANQPGQGQGEPGERGFGLGQIDLAAAAEQLGVSEEELSAALGDLGQGMPDLEAAAAQLGVSVEELYAALGFQGGGMPDFAAAAAQLGVSVEELYAALGFPEGFTPGEGGPGGPQGEPPTDQ